MTRRIIGWLLLAIGIVGLLGDFHVAYITKSSAHVVNAGISLALVVGGLVALVPILAGEIAKELSTYGKAITSVLPGGRRDSDPPAPPT